MHVGTRGRRNHGRVRRPGRRRPGLRLRRQSRRGPVRRPLSGLSWRGRRGRARAAAGRHPARRGRAARDDRAAHAGQRSRPVPGRVRQRDRALPQGRPDLDRAALRRGAAVGPAAAAADPPRVPRHRARPARRGGAGDDLHARHRVRLPRRLHRRRVRAQPVRSPHLRLRPAGPDAGLGARRRRVQRLGRDPRRRRLGADLQQRDRPVDRHLHRPRRRERLQAGPRRARLDRGHAGAGDHRRRVRRPQLAPAHDLRRRRARRSYDRLPDRAAPGRVPVRRSRRVAGGHRHPRRRLPGRGRGAGRRRRRPRGHAPPVRLDRRFAPAAPGRWSRRSAGARSGGR